MKNVVHFIKNTFQFILSLLKSWANSFFKKKVHVIIPASSLSIQTKFRSLKNISIYRNLRLILKMLDITSWNYKQSIGITKKSLVQKQVSWISAFLLMVSINVSAQIAQRGSSTTASTNAAAAAMTINKPTGVVAGDLLIVSIVQNETDNDNGGLTDVTSTGWTLIDGRIIQSDGTANGNNAWYGTILYRVADGTEGSSFAFSLPNSRADMAIGSMVAFSGVNTTGGVKADGTAGGPFDVDPGTLNLANSATATATTLTSASTNAAVVMIGMVNNDRTYSGWAASNPTSLTELFDNVTTNQDDASVGAAWALKSTTGATGNGTVTLSGSDRNAAILLVLKSACPSPNTVAAASSTPTLCVNTALTNITHTTSGATGIGTATGLPAGVSPAFASNTITISGTPTATGTFSYSIPLTGGCGAALNATGTITVNARPTVGASANVTTICSGQTIDLTGTTNITGNFVAGQQNFENTSTYTAVGGQTRTGSSTSSDRPASVSFVTSPTTSYTAINETATITTQNFTGLASGATKTVSMRLAAFSIGSSSNGVDVDDNVRVEISLDGGSNYSEEIRVNGFSNSYWGFTSGTGVAAITYDGNNTATVFAPTVGGNQTTNGFSTLRISLPTSATQVRVRVRLFNDNSAESWVIDDIIVSQSIVPTYSWTSVPAGFTSSLQNPSGVSVSGNTAYTLTATNPVTGCSNTSSVSITVNTSPTITSTTPGSRCGTGSVVLGGVSSTGTVNWFDLPTGGTSLASGNTFNTPAISANTTYYADALSVNGCATGARTPVLATVNAIPSVTSTTPGSRCGAGIVSLGAAASAGTINWFAASSGGSSLGSGTTFNTPSISTSTNYFVEATNNGCASARTLVVATINAIPTVATTTPSSNCGTGTVTLGATSTGTLNWYAASTGGSSLGTGTSFTTPIISSNTTYFVDATANGCSSVRTSVLASIAISPSISSFINGSRCNTGSVPISATPSSGATIKWYAAATGGTALFTGNNFTTPSLSATTTYYAEASVGSCIQPSRTAVTATINTTPVVSITADYCTVPGNVVLTANPGMTSYTWSNGGNTQSINVDQAGNYLVNIVSPAGCFASGSIPVATELITNGSFSAGNTGFTTSYSYVVDGVGQLEMYPEGTYAVVSNPNTVHDAFYGQDRNSPTGKMMVINGSPTLLTVWNQNNISVLPNTTYYFSGWGMSVVNGQNAILQFSINGSQVGTIAYLPNGYTNTAGPYTWVRFYGQWESGPVTTANLSIVNLNTIAGGNDFALDDISFGTMAPVALSANPVISGNAVCQNEPLVLTAGALGGASPFTYSWTGPNGFTSTLENPLVTSTASTTQNGTYTVQVTDGFGCTSSQNIAISVSAAPTNIVISAAASAVCSGGSTSIELPSSEIGVYYQLRNNATNATIGALVQGTGAAISLSTGVLTATTTFNVLATRYPANCDVQMGNTVTVTLSVTPEIAITNQAACSGTVNLTAAGVTAGSTGSGTLSYWTTLAATTAVTTPTAVLSGTYYIKSTNGSCFDIEPVVVSISATPSAAFIYASASYCTTGADPIATVTGTAGVFTASPAGLVFVNTNNGEIDLSASTPGTYSVVNTVTPVGACSPVSVTRSVTITAAPLAGFNYVSNDLCQSANALNASPIFDAGASAGTFSTSAGLSLNTTTGVIDVSASTPGNYAIVNTRAASGGCPAFSDTTFLDINPYIFEGSVSSSSSDDIICLNETINLYSNATTYATVLLREKFNGSINNWININNSTSGNAVNAAWTLRDENYEYSGENYSSNDDSRFYMSNSRANGSGNTSTILRSPVMSTIGFSTLSLDFFHFFDHRNSGDNAKVQISTNNTTWTDLVTYTSDQGSRTGFTNAVFPLNAYIGLPTVYIRFVFTASNDRAWAIDNVSVTGNSINYGYAWSSSPVGFTSALQNPTAVAPLVNSFYTVTATNSYGCSTPTSPIPVTVNPLPADNAGIDQNICGSGSVTLGAAATAGNTYAWTPAATLSSASVAQPVASPVANTTYTLTETITATGCATSNDVDVTVTPLPSITATTPAGRCGTGTVTLSAVSSTGSMKWYANITGGVALGTANSFTTPPISANTTYYVEATSATCVATSRVVVIATINAAPSISSQSTATASYSQNLTANALSLVATAGSGTITGYQWYSNSSASTVGATELTGATSASYVPSTAIVGTLYYYCVVTNSNGCTVNSAFSGAIITLLTPAVTSVTGTTPLVSGQVSSTGYRGQSVTINGTNFASNSTVTINGVAASVTFVNSTQLRAVVNNTGVNSTGNMVVTNPTTGAFVNSSFSYIGYLTSGTSFDWTSGPAWLGNTTPTLGSNATLAHANTCNSAVTASMNQVRVIAGASLTFGSATSSLTTTDLINDGTISWTNSGTLTIGNTIVFSGGAINAGNGTVVFNKAGDQVLFSGLSDVDFNNVTLAGSGIKSLMTNTEMTTNNLIVSAGTTFDLTATDSEIDINGNLTLNGDMNPGTSEFKFTGSADQSILLAGTGTILFNAMLVDKPSGLLLLNDNIQVQESLTMVQGNINTQGFLLEIGKDQTQRGTIAYTSGMIQGKLRRWYAASTNTGNASGLFPMGQDVNGSWKNRNVLLEYSVAPTTGGHLTVEFMAIPMINGALGTQNFITSSNTGGAGFQVSNFSNDGYWKIDNLSSTLIDGEYTIALSGEGFSLPNGLNELTIVKRVGGGDWFCPGTHLAPIGTIGLPTLRRSGVSGFSNFGFAGGPSNPLPITLVNFDGICDGAKVNLSWTTASESNNKMFVIEVSNDAKSWSTVETVLGAGNSNTIRNYTLAVNSSYSNGSYYRLTQIDYNGDSETFDPIYVNCNKQGSNEVSIYPNPAADLTNIDIKASENMEVQLTLFSSTGQILFSQKTNVKEGSNIVKLDVNNLKPGMYHLNIVNDKQIEFSGSRSIIKR